MFTASTKREPKQKINKSSHAVFLFICSRGGIIVNLSDHQDNYWQPVDKVFHIIKDEKTGQFTQSTIPKPE